MPFKRIPPPKVRIIQDHINWLSLIGSRIDRRKKTYLRTESIVRINTIVTLLREQRNLLNLQQDWENMSPQRRGRFKTMELYAYRMAKRQAKRDGVSL